MMAGLLLLGSGALALTPQAYAAGYCADGTATEGISQSDVKVNGVSADDCFGVVDGNITGGGKFAGAPVLNGMDWGTGWTYLDSPGASTVNFMDVTFVTEVTAGSSGTWTLTGEDIVAGALPIAIDLVVGLKAGNEYALWGFDNVLFNGATGGTFSIAFTNNGGNHPALSHMILFAREAGGGSITAVPEADTWAMLLAGLGLVGFAVRRRAV
jgi:hypothetical protein